MAGVGLELLSAESAVLVLVREVGAVAREDDTVEPDATRVRCVAGCVISTTTLVVSLVREVDAFPVPTLRLSCKAAASSSTSSPFLAVAETVREAIRVVRDAVVVTGLLVVSPLPFSAALRAGTAALSLSEVIRVAVGAVDEALVGDSSMASSTRLRVRVGGAGAIILAELAVLDT